MNRPPIAPSNARATARLWVLLALVLAGLLVIPGNLAHLLLAQHAVCAAHGELLHEDEVNATQAGVMLDSASISDAADTAPAIDQSAGSEHEHEHCAIASQGRERTVVDRALLELTLDRDAGPGPGGVVGTALPASSEHRYRLAPKTSPPV